MTLSLERIRFAAAAIKDGVAQTPLMRSRTLSEISGAEVWLKFENLQYTASFKERGALNRLLALGDAERARGVLAMSAGNHGQAVAYHAQRLGVRATIVMPESTPYVKVKQCREFGAEVILAGETLSDAAARADEIGRERALVFVHPYDDEDVIAGQGTVALEMCEVMPDLDALIVPVGGGGLLAGMSIAAHALKPALALYGVEAALFPSMSNALNGRAQLCAGDTIAEGIAVKTPGALTTPILRAHVRDMLLVTEAQIEHAIALLLNIEKTVTEGAGAAALAALIAFPEAFRGKKVGLILSGGNIDPRLLAYVLLRELAREGRILTLRVETQDRPGYLGKLTTLIGDAGGNIIDVTHSRLLTALPAKDADIGLTIETRDAHHSDDIVARLRAAGVVLRRVDESEASPPGRT